MKRFILPIFALFSILASCEKESIVPTAPKTSSKNSAEEVPVEETPIEQAPLEADSSGNFGTQGFCNAVFLLQTDNTNSPCCGQYNTQGIKFYRGDPLYIGGEIVLSIPCDNVSSVDILLVQMSQNVVTSGVTLATNIATPYRSQGVLTLNIPNVRTTFFNRPTYYLAMRAAGTTGINFVSRQPIKIY